MTSHGTNTPIMTAYRALWDEVNDPATVPVALCNAMRRILEHYFKFIGDRDWVSGLDNLMERTPLPSAHFDALSTTGHMATLARRNSTLMQMRATAFAVFSVAYLNSTNRVHIMR